MKALPALALLALTAACTAERPPELVAADEAKLSTELRGYAQAGPPVSCVSQRDLLGNRSAGETAIIFEGRGRMLYVNRPAAGCPDLRNSRAIRVVTISSQLCSGDIVTVFDPVSSVEYGGCGLGEFTPYRRNRR
jgi:hypothetical protein